jgi:hypothetical protein
MANINLSQPQNLEQVRNWYLTVRNSLELYRNEIYKSIRQKNTFIPSEFVGMTENELEKKFQEYFRELSYTVCLNFVASIEASIQNDFKQRVTKKKKDVISRELRELSIKEQTYQISLLKILKIWKENKPELKKIINQYEDILKFRHWLAHGRHWVLKVKIYEEDLVYAQGMNALKDKLGWQWIQKKWKHSIFFANMRIR